MTRGGTLNESRLFFRPDRKSTRLNSSHPSISYAVFCLKKKKKDISFHMNMHYHGVGFLYFDNLPQAHTVAKATVKPPDGIICGQLAGRAARNAEQNISD